jgi:hypothetical protein
MHPRSWNCLDLLIAICFPSSASGRWVYNNTPRHIPWNRYGDPFVHVCDRNHKSRDTRNIAFAEADIVASQGGNWKVTIHNILQPRSFVWFLSTVEHCLVVHCYILQIRIVCLAATTIDSNIHHHVPNPILREANMVILLLLCTSHSSYTTQKH